MTPRTACLLASLLLPSLTYAQAPAYVWGNSPSAATYTPAAGYTSNPAGQGVTIKRSAVGTYEVRLAGMGGAARGGNAQVSAYGPGPAHCNVERWTPSGSDLTVTVRCFSADRPTDAQFSLLFTPPPRAATGPRYAWAGQPTRPTYTAPSTYASNRGQPVNVKRMGAGRYLVSFPGVGRSEAQGGNVQVSGYGTGSQSCKVVSWTYTEGQLAVNVACFQGTAPADAAFTVLFTPGT